MHKKQHQVKSCKMKQNLMIFTMQP